MSEIDLKKIETPKPATLEEIEELKKLLASKDKEISKLQSNLSSSLVAFENQIKENYDRMRELSAEMYTFSRQLEKVNPDNVDINGEIIKHRKIDLTKWDKKQLAVKAEYDRLKELRAELFNTLIAVTLIDDPDVEDAQLVCGVNGDLRGVVYSEDDRTDPETGELIKGTRVQLITYGHYRAIMDSYKLKFRVKKDAFGREYNVPYKVRPILEATMPTDEMIKKHKALLRKGKGRAL